MRTADSTHFRHTRSDTLSNPNRNTGSGTMTATNGVGGTAVHYFEIGGADDNITAVLICWFDATSNAAIVLQTTNLPVGEAAFDSTVATEWYAESTVVTGPTAVAAGCFMLHLGNNAARRNRLKFTVVADTKIDIIPNGVH